MYIKEDKVINTVSDIEKQKLNALFLMEKHYCMKYQKQEMDIFKLQPMNYI